MTIVAGKTEGGNALLSGTAGLGDRILRPIGWNKMDPAVDPDSADLAALESQVVSQVFASSSFGVKRVGNGTGDTATPAVMIPNDVVIPPGVLAVGTCVEIYWEVSHTTASGNFDPAVYPLLSSYPNSLGCDAVRIQPGGAATERAGSGLLRFICEGPTLQHILANPANLGDTGNAFQTTTWDVLNNGLNINLLSEFPANAPASESVTLRYYSITIKKA